MESERIYHESLHRGGKEGVMIPSQDFESHRTVGINVAGGRCRVSFPTDFFPRRYQIQLSLYIVYIVLDSRERYGTQTQADEEASGSDRNITEFFSFPRDERVLLIS